MRILLIALALLAASAGPASAMPAFSAIAGAVTAVAAWVGGLGAIGKAIVGVVLSAGLNFASQKLFGPKADPRRGPTGTSLTVQYGGDVPRQVAVGIVGTKGSRIDIFSEGEDNDRAYEVLALSDSRCEDIEAVWIGGERYELGAGGVGQGRRVIGYEQRADVFFYDGAIDQEASSILLQRAASGRWTADDRMAGVTYVVCHYGYDQETWRGKPDMLFELRGSRLYDWRRDSTAGGVGPQRWDDEETWEWSANPIVALYNYLRGFHRAGVRVVGQGVSPIDLPLEPWTVAADACDVQVVNPDGSTEARYSCSAILSAGVEHMDAIEGLLDACAGKLLERAGEYWPIVGVAQETVVTIIDKYLAEGEPVRYTAKRSRADLANTVTGTYVEPRDGYQVIGFPRRSDPADVAADDGEELERDLALETVSSKAQAQRLAEVFRRRLRHQATASIALGYRFGALEAGDWIRWDSARYGDRRYEIVSIEEGEDRILRLQLEETSAAIYAQPGDEEAGYTPGEPPPKPVLASTLSAFAVEAALLPGATGLAAPALRALWQPVTDPTVIEVVIRYRRAGSDDDWMEKVHPSPPSGQVVFAAGVQARTEYEARATIRTEPGRPTTWTPLAIVTTGETHVVPGAIGMFDENNNLITLGRNIGQAVDLILEAPERADSVPARIEGVLDKVDRLARAVLSDTSARYLEQLDDSDRLALAEQDLTAGINENGEAIARATLTLGARIDATQASVAQEQTTRADGDAALASDISLIGARIDGVDVDVAAVEASVAAETQARVDAVSALAGDLTALTARVGEAEGDLAIEASTRADEDEVITGLVTALDARLGDAEADLTLETSTRVSADEALAGEISTVSAAVDGVEADLTAEIGTRADEDGALAAQITSLSSSIDGVAADLSSESATRADEDGAIASQVSTLSAGLDGAASDIAGLGASVAEQAGALATLEGQATAFWGVRLGIHGRIVGRAELRADDGGDGDVTSSFDVEADAFRVFFPGLGDKPVFTVADYGGGAVAALDGDFFINGSLLVSESVTTPSIASNAITVPFIDRIEDLSLADTTDIFDVTVNLNYGGFVLVLASIVINQESSRSRVDVLINSEVKIYSYNYHGAYAISGGGSITANPLVHNIMTGIEVPRGNTRVEVRVNTTGTDIETATFAVTGIMR